MENLDSPDPPLIYAYLASTYSAGVGCVSKHLDIAPSLLGMLERVDNMPFYPNEIRGVYKAIRHLKAGEFYTYNNDKFDLSVRAVALTRFQG